MDDDNFNYNVTIIDNDCNIINILPHQSIIINENNYEIICGKNVKENKNEDEENEDELIDLIN